MVKLSLSASKSLANTSRVIAVLACVVLPTSLLATGATLLGAGGSGGAGSRRFRRCVTRELEVTVGVKRFRFSVARCDAVSGFPSARRKDAWSFGLVVGAVDVDLVDDQVRVDSRFGFPSVIEELDPHIVRTHRIRVRVRKRLIRQALHQTSLPCGL